MPHNGGRSQFNTPNAQSKGHLRYINMFKGAQHPTWGGTPTDANVPSWPDWRFMNSKGWITSFPDGVVNWYTVFPMPSATQYSETWVCDWVGPSSAVVVAFNVTVESSVANRIEFHLNNLDGGATGDAALNCTAPGVTDIRVYRKIDEALINSGERWYPPHIARTIEAKPGYIRNLGWNGSFDGLNNANTVDWASVDKPDDYFSDECDYYIQSVGNSNIMSVTGNWQFSLVYSGFTLTDKRYFHAFLPKGLPNGYSEGSRAYSGTNGSPLNINWPGHPFANNDGIGFLRNNTPSVLTFGVPYYAIVVDADNIRVSATHGGAAINNNGSTGNCQAVVYPMIDVEGTGRKVMVSQKYHHDGGDLGFIQPNSKRMLTFTYDLINDCFQISCDVFGGFISGGSYRTFIDYCARVGAHPHIVFPFMSFEPITNISDNCKAYIDANYPWMKPLWEGGPNEDWNHAAPFLGTYRSRSISAKKWGLDGDINNVHGMLVSKMGQHISSLYGGDRSKYDLVCAVQTAPFNSSDAGVNAGLDRFTASRYVTDGGDAAYKWITLTCGADYIVSYGYYELADVGGAFDYNAAIVAGDTVLQAALLEANGAKYYGTSSQFPTVQYVVNCFQNLKTQAKSFTASGGTITGMCRYEGGPSPDDVARNHETEITGATKANPCVVTLGQSFWPYDINSPMPGGNQNPAKVGMRVTPKAISGMTQLNGNTYTVTAINVGGDPNKVAINVDSTSFGTYTSGGRAEWTDSKEQVNRFHKDVKFKSVIVGQASKDIRTQIDALAEPGFRSIAPSSFILFLQDNAWSVLDNIYSTANPVWNGLVEYNNIQIARSLRRGLGR